MPSEHHLLPEAIEQDAAMTRIVRIDVLVASRIVELFQPCGDYLVVRHVGAVVDLRARYRQVRRTLGWQVLDGEDRPALVALLGGQAHRQAVAMGVLEVPVDPAGADTG